jgi:hypothetical protein
VKKLANVNATPHIDQAQEFTLIPGTANLLTAVQAQLLSVYNNQQWMIN